MMIDLGREICGQLNSARSREWLVTNGIGGYASGTIAGMVTRRYHSLLMAALQPPLGRTLLLTKFDETALYDGVSYPLFSNQWSAEEIEPHGYQQIETFRLEGAIPTWTFALGDALLEKQVWMQHGANTTYIRYTLKRGSLPLSLSVKAIANYRDLHSNTQASDQPMQVESVADGLRIIAYNGAAPLYMQSDRATVTPLAEWYRGYYLAVEAYRGLNDRDDNFCVGVFAVSLQPGESVTFSASTELKQLLTAGQRCWIVKAMNAT